MARFAYDVNTTQRYIDVHKQFQGGLKTVDTDDSLGAVFLRDAENVSLSEFGFIEKRYGTYENFKVSLNVSLNSILQGYWEFLGKYIVIVVDGRIYHQLLLDPASPYTEFTQFYKIEGLNYPENLNQILGLDEVNNVLSAGSGFTGFQDSRPMGATNIANVLYVFTGVYPIYIIEENNALKAYLFAKDDPTYAELIVVGHNLLENDYENLYYNTLQFPEESIGLLDASEASSLVIKNNTHAPKIPFANGGSVEFNMVYDYKQPLANLFDLDIVDETPAFLNELTLEKVQIRPSGPGATDLSFLDILLADVEFNSLNNVPDTISENINILSAPLDDYAGVNIVSPTNLTTTDLNPVTVKERYWGLADINYGSSFQQKRLLLQNAGNDLFKVEGKQFEVFIKPFDTAKEYMIAGKTLAFSIKNSSGQIIDIEDRLSKVKDSLNSYRKLDSRQRTLEAEVFYDGLNSLYYVLYYKALGPTNYTGIIPIFSYKIFGNLVEGHRIEYEFAGTSRALLNVKLYNAAGNEFYTETLQYLDTENNDLKTLQYTELVQGIPMLRSERTAFNTLTNLINRGTVVELYSHQNANTEYGDPDTILLRTYRLGVSEGFSYKNGIYSFVIPEGFPNTSINHYSWKFKSFDVDITNTAKQTAFLSQTNQDDAFFNLTFKEPFYSRYFLPNIPQFIRVNSQIPFELQSSNPPFTYDIYQVNNILFLQQEREEIGASLLHVKVSDSLLSGTYDFRFIYKLSQTQMDYSTFQLSGVSENEEISYIVKDITITEEKLTDYTFFQGDRAHPIWSCNNVIEHFGKLMVWGSQEMQTALFYSFPDRPFYFPSKFYLDFTNEENKSLVSVTPFMNILVAQTEDQTWGVRGNSGLVDSPSPYIEFSINNTVGTIAPKSVRPVRNHLFFLSKQGVIALKSLYAADEQYNIDFVDRNIRNIVPQDTKAVGIQYDNQYWLNFPNFGITLRWYIDKKAWVQDIYGAWNQFNGVFKYQIKDGLLEFITHPSEFSGREFIYKVGVDYKLPTDLSGNIVAKFETSFLNQNYPFHPKNYKETKLDFTLQNEYNLSRDAVYSMETNEHIASENLHIINDSVALANHFYKLQYDFSEGYDEIDAGTFSLNYVDIYDGGNFTENSYPSIGNIVFSVLVTVDAGTFASAFTDIYDGGNFTENSFNSIGNLDFYTVIEAINASNAHLKINNVTIKEYNSNQIYQVPYLNIGADFVEFQVPNGVKGNKIDVEIEGNFQNYSKGADLYDSTYDSSLNFKAWVISEEQTLNLDNITSYDQAKADVNIDFNDRLGTWVFGTSDFGDKVTAIKTIKLSGRGYNSKIYMEDFSKSKWTLESLGITYKMRRARSR